MWEGRLHPGALPLCPEPPHASLSDSSALPGQLRSEGEALHGRALRSSPGAVTGAARRVRQRSREELKSAAWRGDSAAGDGSRGLGRAGTHSTRKTACQSWALLLCAPAAAPESPGGWMRSPPPERWLRGRGARRLREWGWLGGYEPPRTPPLVSFSRISAAFESRVNIKKEINCEAL